MSPPAMSPPAMSPRDDPFASFFFFFYLPAFSVSALNPSGCFFFDKTLSKTPSKISFSRRNLLISFVSSPGMETPLQITFVSVILPLKFRGEVSYMVPAGLSGKIKTGSRIKVEFGKKIYPAVVEKVEIRSLVQALALSAKEQSAKTTAGQLSGTSAAQGNKIQEIPVRTDAGTFPKASENVFTSITAGTAPEAFTPEIAIETSTRGPINISALSSTETSFKTFAGTSLGRSAETSAGVSPEASASATPGFPISMTAGSERAEGIGGARESAPAASIPSSGADQVMKSVRFKEILAIEELPPVGENEIQLWHKIAEYYMCTVGEVFKAAYPDRVIRQESVKGRKTAEQFFESIGKQDLNKEWSGLPEEGEPEMIINPEFPAEQEIKTIITPELLAEQGDDTDDTKSKSPKKVDSEMTAEPVSPVPHGLETIITPGSRTEPKDSMSPGLPDEKPETTPATESDPQISIASGPQAKQAEKEKASKAPVLSPAQEVAFAQIRKSFRDSEKPVLLQGVTGSGKTEIYIRLAMEQIRRGRNVLYMVPEIAVSKQLQSRLKKVFGERLLTFHSKQTPAEKSRIHKILSGQKLGQKENMAVAPEPAGSCRETNRPAEENPAHISGQSAVPPGSGPDILKQNPESRQPDAVPHAVSNTAPVPNDAVMVLGTRSALFLPYGKLGLIIVDEEHDSSYKQTEPAPRYHARDTAIMLAGLCGAQIVLGSATPSFESEYNCSIGRFKKIRLDEKFYGAREPEVEIIDTLWAYKTRQMKGNFSQKLLNEIKSEIARGGQVLVFRNRRSYSPVVECVECGCIPKCPHCNVYLSYHKYNNTLRCHYCEYTARFNGICPSCGHDALRYKGAGTEKLEEELKNLLPDSRVARFDADVAKSKRAEEQVLKEFARGETDILVGTQMISKGFDFPNLNLVAVIQADTILGIQDFRGDERALQLFHQLMGRTGRRGKRGKLIIQTNQKNHPVLLQLKKLADRSLTVGSPDAGSGNDFININTNANSDPGNHSANFDTETNFSFESRTDNSNIGINSDSNANSNTGNRPAYFKQKQPSGAGSQPAQHTSTASPVTARDYQDPVQVLLAERKEYNFPPYVRMVKIMAKHRNPQKLDEICLRIAGKLATLPCKEFTGPFTPPIDKIRGEWIRCFYVKYARDAQLTHNKALLSEALESLRGSASILPDADPL